jgi:chromosome segregation protein
MFLKRLEINGFKSFAQKTVFEFPTGIVAIVGPNGSGKSNIIDAIRWLLGEREAKNLRGEKIEDLIFAGTAKKPKMSMAQVSLVFDNSSGRLPVDFKEVVVSRKINRSGASQYFINDTEVRLKDIIDFFAKIKLGSKGLTIIGQGSSDLFVRSLPAERIMMVQEILGLREFQLKKSESQRKLKNTKVNLDKVEAMVQEVAPRLRMLKRQTAKWEKRFEVEQELKDLEDNFYAFKIRTLHDLKKNLSEPLPHLEMELKESIKKAAEIEEHLKELEEKSLPSGKTEILQKEKRDLFIKKSALEKDIYKIEAQLEQLEKTVKTQTVSFDGLLDALKEVQAHLQELLSLSSADEIKERIKKLIDRASKALSPQKSQIPLEHKELSQKKGEVELLLNGIEKDIEKIEQSERDISKNVEEFNKNFKTTFTELETLRSKIKNFEDQKNKIIFDKEKNEYKVEELTNYIRSFGGSFSQFEQIALSPSFDKTFSESELADSERKIFRMRAELASIGEIDEVLIKEAKEVETHHAFLVKESQDLAKASADLELLITELNQRITRDFQASFKKVNDAFNNFFRIMFGGGSAKMKIVKNEVVLLSSPEGENVGKIEVPDGEDAEETLAGLDLEVSIPQKKITSLEMLSGGEKSLVSLAALFALIAVSPPPFLVLDEADSALDEKNSKRFADLVKNFSGDTQFIMVTHNRVSMEAAQVLYGVTMDEGGGSKLLSLRLEEAEPMVKK